MSQSQIVKDLARYVPAQFVPATIAFLTVPVLTRSLGAEAFGEYSLSTVAAGIGVVLLGWISTSALRFYAAYERKGAQYSYALTLIRLVGVLGPLLGMLVAGGLALFLSTPSWIVIFGSALITCGRSWIDAVGQLLRVQERVREYNVLRISESLSIPGSASVMIVFDLGLAALLLALGIMWSSVGLFHLLRALPARSPEGADVRPGAVARECLSYGSPLVVGNLGAWVISGSDRYIIAAYGASSDVGVYSASYAISERSLLLVVSLFMIATAPRVLRAYELDSTRAGASLNEGVTRAYLLAVTPIAVVLGSLSEQVIGFLAGQDFVAGAKVLPWVVAGVWLLGLGQRFHIDLLVHKKTRSVMVALLLSAAVSVLGNIVLVPAFGFIAAAWVTTGSYLLTLVFLRVRVNRVLSWSFPWQAAARVSLAAMGAVAASRGTVHFASAFGYGAQLVLGSIMGFMSYAVLLLILGELKDLVGWMRGPIDATAWKRRHNGEKNSGSAAMCMKSLRMCKRILVNAARLIPETSKSARFCFEWLLLRHRSRRSCSIRSAVGGEWGLLSAVAADVMCIRQADAVLSGERWCYGLRSVASESREWHRDHLSGRVWRRWPSGLMEVNRVKAQSDVRVVWELNRLHHLVVMARAYRVAGLERYAEEVVSELHRWTAANPPGFGVNWTCAMEVAIRAVNVAATRSLCAGSRAWSARIDAEVLGLLEIHQRFILRNIEDWGDRSQNHLISDHVGVLAVADACRHDDRQRHIAEESRDALIRAMNQQVYADGVSFENSIPYHMLVTELFALAVVYARSIGMAMPASFLERLGLMREFLECCASAEGVVSPLGDGDDGRVLAPIRYFDATPRAIGHCVEVLEVAGIVSSGSCAEERSELLLRSFPQGGVHILERAGHTLLFNAAPTGVAGAGPHRHNDALSVALEDSVGSVLIDSGTFCYQSSHADRRRYRSVTAHNTVSIDGDEPNDITPLFALHEDKLHVETVEHIESTERVRVAAQHHGYVGTCGVLHRRVVEMTAAEPGFRITDEVSGSGHHMVELRWHFDPELIPVVSSSSGTTHVVDCGRAELWIELRGIIGESEVLVEETTVSPTYRYEVPAHVLVVRCAADLPVSLSTWIVPGGE